MSCAPASLPIGIPVWSYHRLLPIRAMQIPWWKRLFGSIMGPLIVLQHLNATLECQTSYLSLDLSTY